MPEVPVLCDAVHRSSGIVFVCPTVCVQKEVGINLIDILAQVFGKALLSVGSHNVATRDLYIPHSRHGHPRVRPRQNPAASLGCTPSLGR